MMVGFTLPAIELCHLQLRQIPVNLTGFEANPDELLVLCGIARFAHNKVPGDRTFRPEDHNDL